MSLFRRIAICVVAASVGLIGCEGYDEDRATIRCDQERDARTQGGSSTCVDDAAYASCMDVFQDCGDNAIIQETCPTQFSCPE